MAGATLLTLLDDITTMLDDVAGMTKVAAGKTAGIVGDDLALNAKSVLGTPAERELPVVWAVAKGSLVNKAVIVPAAILMSVFLPFLIKPLLMLGGLYLCYEGAEKILHHHAEPHAHSGNVETEAEKIKGAVRTDFILSAEIIVIALGIVATEPMINRVAVLVAVGLGMTVAVYGLVAAIVKLDDFGLHLAQKNGPAKKAGELILKGAPCFMRSLGILGTAAMFMVGGQILWHGIPALHHALEAFSHGLLGMAVSAIFGVIAGLLAVGIEKATRKILVLLR
jgi:predicted DNA repair protein MutK